MAYGGWTGKTLRVDLSTGVISSEDTIAKYKDFLGGSGLGYKVLWDEVPPGTKAWDPANRIIFGVGPLTGTGTPCSGRVTVTTLWPPHRDELPAHGHMGGHWGPELKYAGWDSIIVQGKAAKPVWIKIVDDKVTIEDASQIWGQGIFRATAQICTLMGSDAHVAAIGQAGENLVRLSNVMCDRSHSAGGAGSVMGSKNLKAIGVKGTGSLKIAADKATWKSLNQYYLSLLGCNNQGVVAQSLQAWSEFSPAGTRWWAAPGRPWGAATPPVDTGICADLEHPSADCPSPLNKMGLRTHKGYGDFKDEGLKRTVKMDGCHACPIRCHIASDIPNLESYGASRYNMNTCIGNSIISGAYSNTAGADPAGNPYLLSQMSSYLCDDYGFWSDYSQVTNDFKWYLKTLIVADANNPAFLSDGVTPNPNIGKPVLQKYLSAAEWTMLNTTALWSSGKSPFKLLADGDARFMQFMVPYIAANAPGTLGYYFGLGPARLAALWPELEAAHNNPGLTSFKMGHGKHHGVESGAQIGALINMMMNRDPMNHTHTNFQASGLPLSLMKEISQELFNQGKSIFNATDGSDGFDSNSANTPMNMAKAAFVAQSVIYTELHNSLTLCNYTLPVWASPLKSRNYRGDSSLEAQSYTAVTGDVKDQKGLETVGLRNHTLLRALTALHMEIAHPGDGKDMRNKHDYAYDWMYKPIATGASALDRADIELGKDLLYDQFGWERVSGLPTQATYTSLGLGSVATVMAANGLLP